MRIGKFGEARRRFPPVGSNHPDIRECSYCTPMQNKTVRGERRRRRLDPLERSVVCPSNQNKKELMDSVRNRCERLLSCVRGQVRFNREVLFRHLRHLCAASTSECDIYKFSGDHLASSHCPINPRLNLLPLFFMSVSLAWQRPAVATRL